MENIVISMEVKVLAEDPLLGTLILHTVEGQSDFSINRSVAEGLIGVLGKFLKREKSES